MIRFAPVAAALTLAGVAAAPSTARDRDDVPAAIPTGPPVACVSVRELGESRVRNDRVIDFIRVGNQGYRVTLPYDCPNLGFEKSFSYQTSLTQLCKQDIITVLYQGGGLQRGASCSLAEFQPIRLANVRR